MCYTCTGVGEPLSVCCVSVGDSTDTSKVGLVQEPVGAGLSDSPAGATGGDDEGTGHAVEELAQVQLGCTNLSVPVYNTVVVKNFRY